MIVCMLHCRAIDEKVSVNFLGLKDDSASANEEAYEQTPEHTHRLNNHLLSMKGLLPTSVSGGPSFSDEGLFDHPNLFNMSLLMILFFVAVLSLISATAGVILFVHSSGISGNKLDSNNSYESPSAPDSRLTLVGMSHPGCLRILLRDTQDKKSNWHPITATVSFRE